MVMIDMYELYLRIDEFIEPSYIKGEKTMIKRLLKQGVRWYGFTDGFTLLDGAIFRYMEANGYILKDGNLDFIKMVKCFKELYPDYKGK